MKITKTRLQQIIREELGRIDDSADMMEQEPAIVTETFRNINIPRQQLTWALKDAAAEWNCAYSLVGYDTKRWLFTVSFEAKPLVDTQEVDAGHSRVKGAMNSFRRDIEAYRK